MSCDSGFGHRLALKLNKNGFRVYATVFSHSSAGAQQLAKSAVFVDKMHVLEMDVTNDEKVKHTYSHVKRELDLNGDKLWALVNNAGLFASGHIEWGTLDTYRQVFDVNVFGMVRVTRVFVPLVKASKGRIVNMVSLGGRFTFENGGVYCMSKHSMIAFSDALRREMHRFGVKVCTLEPGVFKTPMTDSSGITNLISKTWDQSEDSVKKSYGNAYFEGQKKVVQNFQTQFKAGANIDLVVDDMIDAIQSTDPEITYRPVDGLQSKISVLIPAYMPSEWTDRLVESSNKYFPEGVLE